MSSICLCATSLITANEVSPFQKLLNEVAVKYNRGIQFNLDWEEPIAERIKDSHFVMSLSDSPEKGTCEKLLLPDGWLYNGMSSSSAFSERMLFLVSLAEVLLNNHKSVDFYIATSGALPCDYEEARIRISELAAFLEDTVGRNGTEKGVHITVFA